MKITPIVSSNIYHNYTHNTTAQSFTAHPDFYKFNSTQSCYFRRGAVVLPCYGYRDIEKTFNKIFDGNDKIKSMLVVGIGHSQEPFSYLASIKSILKGKSLKQNLSLHTVDLQSKPDDKTLFVNAFYDGIYEDDNIPKFAQNSFVLDRKYKYYEEETKKIAPDYYFMYPFIKEMQNTEEILNYRVNDEILNFVKETYNNPEKSKWDCRIQDAILYYNNEKFDIVSANNVLPYIISNEEIINTIKNIKRVLKPNGYFITDPYEQAYWLKDTGVLDSFKEIYKGIYRKK